MEKKTECEIVEDLLIGYVDNTLNSESKKLVENHLSECSNCKEMLKEILEGLKQDEDSQQKEIDYLKKVRIKSKIKSIVMALGIILIIVFGLYLNKFIKINSIMTRGAKTLETQNYYSESQEILGNEEVMVNRTYYKDGKYKRTTELYSKEGIQKYATRYGEVGADEIIEIDEANKKINIRKGDIAKIYNKEDTAKWDRFQSEERKSIYLNLGKTFLMDIKLEHYGSNKEYYVLKNQFKDTDKWEVHLDKETGLVIKELSREAEKRFFPGTDVVSQINDRTTTYKYEFDIVKDEDVEVPNLDGYTVEYINEKN